MTIRTSIEVATSIEDLERRAAEWISLETRSLEDNVYVSAPFLTIAARHFGSPFRIAFIYDKTKTDRELIGVAPFSLQPRTRFAPFKRLSTFNCLHTFLPNPMFDRTRAGDAARALVGWMDGNDREWGLIVLEQIDVTSPTWREIDSALSRKNRTPWVKRRFPQAILKKRESFDAYLASLPRSLRKGYKRARRRLEKEGRVETLLHRNLETAPDMVERFLDVESRSWQAKYGDEFARSSVDLAFFSDLIRELARSNRLFFVELCLDNRPIAINLGFVGGRTLFGYRVAFDERFKAFSPGSIACVEEVRFFHETDDLEAAQSGTDLPDSYMSHYWRDRVPMQGMTIPTARWASRAYTRTAPGLFRLVERGRHRRGRGDPASVTRRLPRAEPGE